MQPQQPESPEPESLNLEPDIPMANLAESAEASSSEGIPKPPNDQQAQTDNVPAEWPGAFGLYKYSKASIMINIWSIIGLFIIVLLVGLILETLSGSSPFRVSISSATSLVGANPFLAGTSNLVSFVINSVIGALIIVLVFAGIKGQKQMVGQAFASMSPMILVNYIIGLIIVMVLYFISFLFFIVPFFIIFHRLLLVPYIIIDQRKDPIEAVRISWDLTRGLAGLFWGIIGANIAMGLLLFTIIGIPFSIYFLVMYQAAFPIAYFYLIRPSSVSATSNIAPSPVPPTV